MSKTAVLMIALTVMAMIPACAQQYNAEKDFTAKPVDGGKGVEITGYVGDRFEVRIPPRIQNLPVTSIGEEAFLKKNIASVTMPNSVTSIGMGAFSFCRSLASVTIPNSVTSIGQFAFSTCTSLASVIIPNSVTSIEAVTFSMCTSLANIIIPNSVTSIDLTTFSGCTSLAMINVDAANTTYSSHDGILYNKNKSELIAYPRGKTGAFIIPSNVTSIGDFAFFACANLTSVTIPNIVTSIGVGAFFQCTSLASVTFQGTIPSDGFQLSTFPGDLHTKYLAGGIGTYTTTNPGENAVWTKQ